VAYSLLFAAADLSAAALCFSCAPFVCEHPLLTPLYAGVTGLVMWMCFVVGHDCGHASFSKSQRLNDIVGHISHSILLVPYWPWAYSHKQHHRFHNHRTKDHSHPWFNAEEYEAVNPIVRFLALDHPWGAFLGFPGYLLLEPRWSGTDGSHFNPDSRLFDRAPLERRKCAISTACVASFLSLTIALSGFDLSNWFIGYGAPYLVFSWWLFTVTYLQHHADETETFEDGEWNYVLGALETVDRRFGYGVDHLTHHITDGHTAHHLFSDLPHYALMPATKALRPLLEATGRYKRKESTDFYAEVFRIHDKKGHCVEADRPRAFGLGGRKESR